MTDSPRETVRVSLLGLAVTLSANGAGIKGE